MSPHLGKLGHALFHRRNRSAKEKVETSKGTLPAITAAPSSDNDPDLSQTQLGEDATPRDLWQDAFDKLNANYQHILSATQPYDNNTDKHSRVLMILDQVVQTTQERYKEYKMGGLKIRRSQKDDINLRDAAQKIINVTLSFKDIIGNVASFDPTGHASGVWMIVSLGLTVCGYELVIARKHYSALIEYKTDGEKPQRPTKRPI